MKVGSAFQEDKAPGESSSGWEEPGPSVVARVAAGAALLPWSRDQAGGITWEPEQEGLPPLAVSPCRTLLPHDNVLRVAHRTALWDHSRGGVPVRPAT